MLPYLAEPAPDNTDLIFNGFQLTEEAYKLAKEKIPLGFQARNYKSFVQ